MPDGQPPPPLAPAHRSLPEYLRYWAETAPDRRAFTFVDHPAPHSRGVHRTLTWRRLDLRVRALAARLAEEAEPGTRVALLCPQGTEYITAFLAALTAGLVAVPLYPPGLPGHGDRLAAVLDDAGPAVVLTTSHICDEVREFCASLPVRIIAVDQVPDTVEDFSPVEPDGDSIAYLQYTSGSTRSPAGVEITHGNVVANARQALAAYGLDERPATCVGWLPLYHDMGLVLSVAAPVVRGLLSVLMDPAAFLHEPARWLRLLTAHPRALSAAPNFAYDYCASAVTEAQKRTCGWTVSPRCSTAANRSVPPRSTASTPPSPPRGWRRTPTVRRTGSPRPPSSSVPPGPGSRSAGSRSTATPSPPGRRCPRGPTIPQP